MSVVLAVRELVKSFGGISAVDAVSFELHEAEVLALIGPNGAGKTTCFNMLMGQLRPDSGTIHLHGRPLVGLAPRNVWRMGVGRTFQITATYPSMTLAENIQTALLSHHRKSYSLWRPARQQYRGAALDLLALVDMADQVDRPAAELAYGDLKRLELAIALAHQPRLLLLDEPTAGMAPKERLALMQLTATIVTQRGLSVLFTEHDMDVVFTHAHRIMVLNRGRLIASGSSDAIRGNAEVQQVYLGGGAVFAARTDR